MTKRAPSVVVCLLAGFLLVGCGGGGGGDSASLYTGITSPSMITDNNAEEIALQAYQAGDLSTSAVSVLGVSGNGNAAVGSPNVLTLVRLLKEGADRMPVLSHATVPMNSSPPAHSMTVIDNTIDDGFGGSITLHLSIDDQTGEFNGTFEFKNWSGDGGGTISGLASVSGSFNMTGEFFTHIRFSFNPITMEDGLGLESVTIYGTLDLETDGSSSASSTMNIFLRDNTSLETVWISNYTMALTEHPDYVDAIVSGRVYLPNHGYVQASTPTPFRYYAGYSLPSSGVLLVTGSGGRSARLVVISAVPQSPGYYVEADLDGDSVYDWTGSDQFWP